MASSRKKKRYGFIAGAALMFVLILLLKEFQTYLNHRKALAFADKSSSFQQPAPGFLMDMMAMQTHMAHLSLAGKARNWDSAGFELEELKNAMEAAGSLRFIRNSVDISDGLNSTLQSRIEPLGKAIQNHDSIAFQKMYGETLAACVHCHQITSPYLSTLAKP